MRTAKVISVICVFWLLLSYLVPITAFAESNITDQVTVKDPFYNIDCVYESKAKRLIINFRMNNEDVRMFGNSKIDLYELSVGQTVKDINELTPVKTGISPSTTSKVEVEVKGLLDRLSMFVLSINHKGITYTSQMIYPAISSSQCIVGFKGTECNAVSTTAETLSSTAIVDIDIDSLVNGSGYLYKSDGTNYSFNSNYVQETDNRIRHLHLLGADILIRLYSGSGDYSLFDGSFNASRKVYAYLNFLYSRYSSDEYGGIKGVILGDSSLMSIVSPNAYAKTMYAVGAMLTDIGQESSVIIPMPDSCDTVKRFIGELVNNPIPMFTVMIENKKQPNIKDMRNLITYLNSVSKDVLYPNIIYNYCMSTEEGADSEKGIAEYVYRYKLIQYLNQHWNNKFSTFIISATQHSGLSYGLTEAIRYINTEYFEAKIDVSKVLNYYGADSLDSLFGTVFSDDDKKISLSERSFAEKIPEAIIGKADYFVFSSSEVSSKWHSGNGVKSITTVNAGTDENGNGIKAMSVKLNNTVLAHDSYVIRQFDTPENFHYTDYITVEFMINAKEMGGSYRLRVDLDGKNDHYRFSSSTVKAGEMTALRMDVRALDRETEIDRITIGVEDNNGIPDETELLVYSVYAESSVYESEDLKNLLIVERTLFDIERSADKYKKNKVAIVILVVVILLTAVLMMIIGRNERKESPKRRENNERY